METKQSSRYQKFFKLQNHQPIIPKDISFPSPTIHLHSSSPTPPKTLSKFHLKTSHFFLKSLLRNLPLPLPSVQFRPPTLSFLKLPVLLKTRKNPRPHPLLQGHSFESIVQVLDPAPNGLSSTLTVKTLGRSRRTTAANAQASEAQQQPTAAERLRQSRSVQMYDPREGKNRQRHLEVRGFEKNVGKVLKTKMRLQKKEGDQEVL